MRAGRLLPSHKQDPPQSARDHSRTLHLPLNGGDFDTQSYNKSTKTAGSDVKTDLPRYPETRLLRRIQHVTRFTQRAGWNHGLIDPEFRSHLFPGSAYEA